MNGPLTVRRYCATEDGDAGVLRAIFMSSVHALADRSYTRAQLAAWAPLEYDHAEWAARLARNQPFVAEYNGQPAGFADVQADGYIDQFYVGADYAGRGVASLLMATLLDEARRLGLRYLYSHVSLRAQPFFMGHGFVVEEVRQVAVRGQVLENARMGYHAPAHEIDLDS